jgi:dipeptidyl aminopeptidase/acylaminoacyl peptidase
MWSYLGKAGVIRYWDITTGEQLRQIECDRPPGRVEFSPDGRTFAGTGNRSVLIWDFRTGKELLRIKDLPNEIVGVHFSPDGKILAGVQINFGSTKPADFYLWEAATGKELRKMPFPEQRAYEIRFSPDGKLVAVAGKPQAIVVWDVSTGKEYSRMVVPKNKPDDQSMGFNWGGCLEFSPDGRTLATGLDDGIIRLWEVATAQERGRLEGHQGEIASVDFSPDGTQLLSGSVDTTALIWDVTGLRTDHKPLPPLAPKDLAALWSDLTGADAIAAHRAIWRLAAAPRECVPFLEKQLPPASVDEQKVVRLLADLDNEQFAVRDDAMKELGKIGGAAEPAMRDLLKGSPSVEYRRRVEQLLEKLEGPISLPESRRAVRCVEVLEHIGTPEAQRLLKTLADGAKGALLTREAQASLDRLAKRAAEDR